MNNFLFHYSVTINKTSDLDNNTDTLKKLSAADKPNNQTKLASVSGAPLPPSQMKCNILKGNKIYILYLNLVAEFIWTTYIILTVKSMCNKNNIILQHVPKKKQHQRHQQNWQINYLWNQQLIIQLTIPIHS